MKIAIVCCLLINITSNNLLAAEKHTPLPWTAIDYTRKNLYERRAKMGIPKTAILSSSLSEINTETATKTNAGEKKS